MVGDHLTVLAVQRNGGVVKALLGMLHRVVQLRHAALEYGTEVAWQQRAPDC